MRARLTVKKPQPDEVTKTRGYLRSTEERFLLRVDGQTKRSFSSKEPALSAGSVIKKAFPVVMVSIEDTKDGTSESVHV